MKTKICGITNLEDALAACEAGADALGFVFALEAKARGRYIDPEDAYRIIEQLPAFVLSVAVCVNEPIERLVDYLGFVDRVQLCGEESAEDCHALGPWVIKAFGVSPDFDPRAMLAYPGSAYLLDTFVRGAHGGSGMTCDWQRARDAVALGRPTILSGGLTPDNVAEAVQAVHPYAVDTSGGVESAPGKKDHERIRRFIENAQAPLS